MSDAPASIPPSRLAEVLAEAWRLVARAWKKRRVGSAVFVARVVYRAPLAFSVGCIGSRLDWPIARTVRLAVLVEVVLADRRRARKAGRS
jgi:hypothetical protein